MDSVVTPMTDNRTTMQDALNKSQYNERAYMKATQAAGISDGEARQFRGEVMGSLKDANSPVGCIAGWFVFGEMFLWVAVPVGVIVWVFYVLCVPLMVSKP